MFSDEPPPPAEVDPALTLPSTPDSQAADVATADGPVPVPVPADPRVHANPPQSDTSTAPPNPPPAVEASAIILSPIPKKSNLLSDQITQSPSSQTRSNSFDGTSSLNLPEGVVVPPTVTAGLINKVSGSLKAAFFQVRCFVFLLVIAC
jgi:hypothetical protein